MSIKTSYSQNNTYTQCSKHWHLLYREGWEGTTEGASTYFGSAIDAAVGAMLEGKQDWLQIFNDRWMKSWNFGKSVVIFDNLNIVYSYKDFDADILDDSDLTTLMTWANHLNLNCSSGLTLYKEIVAKKKNPYKKLTQEESIYFNRAAWLSLKKKGKILLDAFHTQFYPKITKVVATQQKADIKDQTTGDSITGFIDMVLEIEGYDKPIIFDLKTAGQPYSQEDIDLTQQLTLYSAMKSGEYNTDLVGYVVLSKNIPKITVSTCKTCGSKKQSTHSTCNALDANGKRCKGEWDEKITVNPEVQVLVEKKTEQQVNDLLLDYGNIILGMKQEIFYKNTSKCNNWYGSPCVFYDVCHKNSYDKVVKKKSKS